MAQQNDGEWGPWVDWAGGECPIPDAKAGEYDLRFEDGNPSSVVNEIPASMWNWRVIDAITPIIAYRVRQQEDLLARAIEALRSAQAFVEQHGDWHTSDYEIKLEVAAIIAEYDKRVK